MSGTERIEIEDFYGHNMCRRYGGIRPRHEKIESILSQNLKEYGKLIEQFHSYTDQFLSISLSPTPQLPTEPAWVNGFFPAFDSIALFGLISQLKPKLYLEIGSGYSTAFAAKAKALNSPQTRIVSIDPYPRSEIDTICDEIIRKPLEECDLSIFDELSENDIVFFDGTHRVLQNSDAEVFFFDIMPRLMPEVYIHFHDIFWPSDYPEEWVKLSIFLVKTRQSARREVQFWMRRIRSGKNASTASCRSSGVGLRVMRNRPSGATSQERIGTVRPKAESSKSRSGAPNASR